MDEIFDLQGLVGVCTVVEKASVDLIKPLLITVSAVKGAKKLEFVMLHSDFGRGHCGRPLRSDGPFTASKPLDSASGQSAVTLRIPEYPWIDQYASESRSIGGNLNHLVLSHF